MKHTILMTIAVLFSAISFSQAQKDNTGKRQLGLKAGVNFSTAHVKNAGDLKFNSRQGLIVAGFFSPATKGVMGFRSEVVYSRQGFATDIEGNESIVTSDYLFLPQFTTVNITRFFQLQLGGQVGYLLRADTKQGSERNSLKDFTNRIDYGAAGGVEIYPFKGLIIGGRYSMSLGNMYKQSGTPPLPSDSPLTMPDVKLRNGVVSFFAGYRF